LAITYLSKATAFQNFKPESGGYQRILE